MRRNKNGYKFYNSRGISCRINCDDNMHGKIIIQFREKNSTNWSYYVPNKQFSSTIEIVNYIITNLENQHMIFKINKLAENIK